MTVVPERWRGYMLINVAPGKHTDVVDAISELQKKYRAIKSVEVVYGTTDLVVILDADNEEGFYEGLVQVASSSEYITSTSTLPVAKRGILKRVGL
jgi:DNA-binding Lrp family transcriptional regulator